MKLLTALEIAKDCELQTVGEAIYNVQLRLINLFAYDEIENEWKELVEEYNNSGFNFDYSIDDCIKKLRTSERD